MNALFRGAFSSVYPIIYLFAASAAQAGLVKLAESGDLEPGGTNEFFIISSDPTINERGQVAFYCDLRNNGFARGFGFFLSDGETNTTIAKTGQPAPDANGNFNTFHDPAALNTGNQIFLANLTGTLGGSSDNVGIYQVNGGVLTQLARTGQPAAPNSGTFQSLANASIPVNRNGQAAFVGRTSSNLVALFRSTGTTLTRLAYYTQPSPDGNGTLGNLFVTPAVNHNGQVAFLNTMLSTINGSGYAFLLADENSLKVLTRLQRPSPDGNGAFSLFPNGLTALNDHGQIAFLADLSGTSGGAADNEGLYRTDGDTTVQLARKGQFVPNGNGRFLDFGDHVAINDSGQVAFFADLTGTTGGASDNAGMFLADGNSVKQLVRKGQAAPDTNGVYSTFGLNRPALNNKGQVAFKATLAGTSGNSTDNEGVFLVDADGSILQIIRSGWIIDGETVFTPNFLEGPNYGGMTALNDEGQMAVWSALNGNHAIYLWSRPKIGEVITTNNAVSVSWTSYGAATDVVQAASSLTDAFTNIAVVSVRANWLVRTNFSEPIPVATKTRFYRIGETK